MTEEEKKQIRIINNFVLYCRGFEEKKYTDSELFLAIENVSDLIQKQQVNLEKKEKKISDLKYALLDMVMQFADRPHRNGCEYSISTMGLSALELAFNELDLDDPTPMKKANEMYEKLQKQYFEKQVESESKK